VEKTILEKMRLKPGKTVKFVNVPLSVNNLFQYLPDGSKISPANQPADFVVIFIKNMQDLQKVFPIDSNFLTPDGALWLAYPKKTSGIDSDIDRDIIWNFCKAIGWIGVFMVSIDEVWSGFRLKRE
jgi:hypothetical protein